MRTRGAWVLGAMLCLACGEDAPARPAPSPAAEAAPAIPPPTPELPPSTETAPETELRPPPPPPRDERERVRARVREARAAARRGDRPEALRAFREALAITPRDPRLHCELGYLAIESDRALAAQHLGRGLAIHGDPRLVRPPLRAPLAMCLYNMGLLLEAGDDPWEAESYFEDSLALRENETVRRHLRAVQRLEHEPGELFDLPSLEALAQHLATPRECEDTDDHLWRNDDGLCSGGHEVTRRIAATDAHPEVGWMEAHFVSDMVDDAIHLIAIRRPEGWAVMTAVSHMEDNTDHGHSGEGAVRPGAVRALANGWLAIEWDESFEESSETSVEPEQDPSAGVQCWATGTTTHGSGGVALCDLRAESVACRSVYLRGGGSSSGSVWCTGPDDEAIEPPPWAREWAGDSEGREWELALDVEPDRARLRTVRAPRDDEVQIPRDQWMEPASLWDALEELYPL